MGRSSGKTKRIAQVSARKKVTRPSKRKTIAKNVTDRVIEDIKKNNVLFWQKPWAENGLPTNLQSGNKYRGINRVLLAIAAGNKGYNSSVWMTYKQAEKKSYKDWLKKEGKTDSPEAKKEYDQDPSLYSGVRLGEKGESIVFFEPFEIDKDKDGNPLLDKDGNPTTKEAAVMRRYSVFNADQTDLGIPPDVPMRDSIKSIKSADDLIASSPNLPPIAHGGDVASYSPSEDRIRMPDRARFKSDEEYYQTLFHEIIHATGHKSRTGRMDGSWTSFGSDPYAEEELVAEIGSAMILAELGIDTPKIQKNQSAYIKNWVKRFEDNETLILDAAAKAQKALDFIFGENS